MMRLIDADALIHELNNSHYPGAPYIDAGISIAIGKVCDAPTIESERKKGKWIPHSETCREYIGTVLVRVDYDYWLCDACGYRVEKGQPMYKFCPNCGADMRG